MENLKRKFKIFWVEHGDPILFAIIIIVGVIVVVQALNAYVILKNKNSEESTTVGNNIKPTMTAEDKENKKQIEKFIQYCKNKQIEEAYDLVSEKCKQEIYPTEKDFINKYYNKFFLKEKDTEVIYLSENNYEIRFYESILESGKIEDRNYIISNCKIEAEVVENRLYIID